MAAIIQLACKGIQDYYLTADPEVTNFRAVYKRHTQFAVQVVKNIFTTPPNFGGKFSCTIARAGDLLCKMYLVLVLPTLHVLGSQNYEIAWVKKVAFKLVKSIELEIGSLLVEKHYGEWYNIWYELSTPYNARYNELIGLSKELNSPSKYIPCTELVIPLSFWFNKSFSQALPLLSLPEQEVKINIELSDFRQCIITNPTNYIKIKDCLTGFKKGDILIQYKNDCCTATALGTFTYEDIEKSRIYYEKILGEFCEGKIYKINKKNYKYYKYYFDLDKDCEKLDYVIATSKECIISDCHINKLVDAHLLCEYVLLSGEEKEKLIIKNRQRDYVIEQVLYCDEKILTGPKQVNTLKFSNLCRELIWIAQLDEAVIAKQYFNYTRNIYKTKNCDSNIIKKQTVLVDNIERLTYRDAKYFTHVQPYNYHTSTDSGINVYSFSLFPEELQPSGAINLENISSIGLKLSIYKHKKYNNVRLRCYARTHNVFRLCDNLGALLFNNNNI